MKRRRQRKKEKDTSVRVLCASCSEFFNLPRPCLECCYWNICDSCVRKDSQEIRAVLAARGINLGEMT